MRFQIIITSLIIYFCITTKAQNLVPNPSFEKINYNYYEKFSNEITINKDFPNEWEVSAGTPLFLHLDLPLNEFNDKENLTPFGSGYIMMLNGEVISTMLKAPLVAGEEYLIKIYVAKSIHFCSSGIKNITVAFTKSPFNKKVETIPPLFFNLKHINLYSIDFKAVRSANEWVEFSNVYKAKGGEHYFHLGTFTMSPSIQKENDGAILIDSLKNDNRCTLICYDNVSIELSPFKKNSPVVVSGILFENNKSVLKKESIKSLDQLYNMLVKLNKKKIKINGHTDNSGNETNNKKLSEERAKEVMKYLVKKGIPANKITFAGYGGSKPISDNTTPEGNAKNRRVDVELMN